VYRGVLGGGGTAVLGVSFGSGAGSLPRTGVPLMLLLLIALTMVVVGVVMTRVAFGSAPAGGQTPPTRTTRGTKGS